MPSSWSETRAEGTARVTADVASWLWSRGSRCLVPEVGLHPVRGLCQPWDGRWRVDMVATVPRHGAERVDVIEVKGSADDLRREDLGTGKWVLRYDRMGLTPWLALSHTVSRSLWQDLNEAWGVIVVEPRRTTVVRDPAVPVYHSIHQPNDDVTAAYRALATVATLQSLPMLMGLDRAARASAMYLSVNSPWHRWMPETRVPRVEGPGNIL